jgi:toxin YoeB
MRLVFAPQAWEDYLHWQAEDRKVLVRINGLLKEAMRDPFRGTGKPEPLSGNLSGWWSRRITGEHRLVYRVSGKDETQALALEVAQVRYHY